MLERSFFLVHITALILLKFAGRLETYSADSREMSIAFIMDGNTCSPNLTRK